MCPDKVQLKRWYSKGFRKTPNGRDKEPEIYLHLFDWMGCLCIMFVFWMVPSWTICMACLPASLAPANVVLVYALLLLPTARAKAGRRKQHEDRAEKDAREKERKRGGLREEEDRQISRPYIQYAAAEVGMTKIPRSSAHPCYILYARINNNFELNHLHQRSSRVEFQLAQKDRRGV